MTELPLLQMVSLSKPSVVRYDIVHKPGKRLEKEGTYMSQDGSPVLLRKGKVETCPLRMTFIRCLTNAIV